MIMNLNSVAPNPYRDFNLDPINDATVEKMKKSIETLDFWGGLAARRHGNGYQLVFGHHRLEALRSLGRKQADITIVNYDEDQMVKGMVAENALQRGGASSAHLDGVQAIIRRLAYIVLSQDNQKALVNLPELFENLAAVGQARSKLEKGDGIGRDLIERFDNTLPHNSIKEALVALKASGHMHTTIKAVREQLEAEAEAARVNAERVQSAKKKAAAEKEADEKEAAAQAAEIAEEATPDEVIYDAAVGTIFKRDSHNTAFREAVTSPMGREHIPVNRHLAMAAAIVQDAETEKASINKAYIKAKVNAVLAEVAALLKSERKKIKQMVLDDEVAKQFKSLRAAVRKAIKNSEDLYTALQKGGRILGTYEDTFLSDGPALQTALRGLSERLNIGSDDKVISHQ